MDTPHNTQVVLRLDDPLELLAYLPYRLGFWPEESAVFFSLRACREQEGIRWDPGLVARVDLADLAHPDSGVRTDVRSTMLGHLRNDGAEVVFLVLYTQEPVSRPAANPTTATSAGVVTSTGPAAPHGTGPPSGPAPSGAGPAAEVVRWWLDQGVAPDAARIWVVSADTFRCLECRGEPCCPATGHPLSRIGDSRIGAEMVFRGMTYASSRAHVVQPARVDQQVRRDAVRAAARWRRRRVAGGPGRRTWLTGLARRWDQALADGVPVPALSPAELAALLVGLEEPLVRDAVLLSVATGTPAVRALNTDGTTLLDQVFGSGGPAPDQARMRRSTEVLHLLTAVAARGRAAGAWAVLAWLAWFEGNGARADLCAAECLTLEPAHRLGELIRRAVVHGIPPGWARVSPAA